jgi:hypothetical protein
LIRLYRFIASATSCQRPSDTCALAPNRTSFRTLDTRDTSSSRTALRRGRQSHHSMGNPSARSEMRPSHHRLHRESLLPNSFVDPQFPVRVALRAWNATLVVRAWHQPMLSSAT